MKYAWHLRWAIPALLVGLVGWQGLFAAGTLTTTTTFQARTPVFDVLLPAGRVVRTPQGMVLQQEPVYVDVRLPARASAVTLELELVQQPAPVDLTTAPKLGVQISAGFTFDFAPPPQRAGNVLHYRATVPALPYVQPGHKLRFILSAPGMAGHKVVVHGAQVSLARQPFSWLRSSSALLVSYDA